MGGGCTANQTMIALSKEIWKVLLKKNITISAKYLPSALKKEANWEAGNSRDSSDWKLYPPVWSSPYRSVCITSIPTARKLSFLDTRATQRGGGCNATKLVSSIKTHPIGFSPFLLDSKSLTQNSIRPSLYDDTCSANLADTTLVRHASTIINSQSNHHTLYAKSTAECTKAGSSVSGKQNIKVNGLKRESLIDSGLSESATTLTSSARRPSSNSNYDACWG